MRPPVSGTMRTPARDLRLGPYTLPAGTLINVNLGVMGNSALNYTTPELYLPVCPTFRPYIQLTCTMWSLPYLQLAGVWQKLVAGRHSMIVWSVHWRAQRVSC